MHAFETDASNATLNPLHRPKENIIPQPRAKQSYRWWIVRIVLFLVAPIILIWTYLTMFCMSTYGFVMFLGQTTTLRSAINESSKSRNRLVYWWYVCGRIDGYGIVPDTSMHTGDRYIEKPNTNLCVVYQNRLADMRRLLHQTKVLATPTVVQGQSLAHESIRKVIKYWIVFT